MASTRGRRGRPPYATLASRCRVSLCVAPCRAPYLVPALIAVLLAACQPPPEPARVLVTAPMGVAIDGVRVRGPSDLVLARSPARLEITLPTGGALRVAGDEICPLEIAGLAPGARVSATAVARLVLAAPRTDVGFGAEFEVRATLGCDPGARVSWRQSDGAPLDGVSATGDVYRARLPTFDERATRWGIVPVSPRTRGEVEIEATIALEGGVSVVRRARVAAASRARGLSSVALGTRLLLGGGPWRVAEAPPGASARVVPAGPVAALSPDVAGQWRLLDAGGRSLLLRAESYDATPLDCARGDCHATLAAPTHASAMTGSLARAVGEGRFDACMLGCHATGEPGTDDGGFVALADALGVDAASLGHTQWNEWPRALRRAGGVGCLACHGPGAIPAPESRWAILQSDVCAACHDAPPRYPHVAAWRSTRMAVSDRDPTLAARAECARCHSTSGFLLAQGVLHEARPAPEGVPAPGIACAACHAPHAEGVGPRLLRRPALPAGFTDAEVASDSRVCVACHASDAANPGGAAWIWAARGGLDADTGAALGGAPAASSCVDCHLRGAGASHAFRASRREPGREAFDARVAELRARFLPAATPPHAGAPRGERAGERARALADLRLLIEDPAALEHNPGYARALLGQAARLDSPRRP